MTEEPVVVPSGQIGRSRFIVLVRPFKVSRIGAAGKRPRHLHDFEAALQPDVAEHDKIPGNRQDDDRGPEPG